MNSNLLTRLFLLLLGYVILGELVVRYVTLNPTTDVVQVIIRSLVQIVFLPELLVRDFLIFKSTTLPWINISVRNIYLFGVVGAVGFLVAIFGARKSLVGLQRFYGRIYKEKKRNQTFSFEHETIELRDALKKHGKRIDDTKGDLFLGQTKDSRPFLYGPKLRTYHTQVLGKTGSGKSVLLSSMIYQDIKAGRGAIVIDGKGELEFANLLYEISNEFGRANDFRFFSLAFPKRSQGYNPLNIDSEDDVSPCSQRVFSVFDMENPYFRQQAESYFCDLVAMFHGTGKKFTFRDLHRCITFDNAFDQIKQQTQAIESVVRIEKQLEGLGNDAKKTLSGLESWLRKFGAIEPLNAHSSNDELSIRDIIATQKIAYFQLPGAYQQIFSTAVGKILLQDIVMEIARRQLNGGEKHYYPVYVDEFYNFAYPGFIDAINKGRSSNILWTLAHQSLSDLKRVSAEFEEGVWDNTRNKIVLSQNNKDLCERISKDIGTFETEKHTIREQRGLLWTRRSTGEISTRKVDEFKFDPNRIKNLKSFGQAYFINEQVQVALNLPYLDITPKTDGLLARFDTSPISIPTANDIGLDAAWRKSEKKFFKKQEAL